MLIEQIKLEADEKLLLIVRKHWFILFKFILADVLLALLPLLAYLPLSFLVTNFDLSVLGIPASFMEVSSTLWFFYLAWLLLIWIHFTNHLTDYTLDLWAITDRRIVAIDQRGYFRRFLSSFRLERLQDMNIEVNGLIPTLLNFGTIEAQTAGGSNEEFRTENMPDPRGLKALIINAADKRQQAVNSQNHQGL